MIKLAPKDEPFRRKALGIRSYYNEAYGNALWAEIVAWKEDNYPRKSWSIGDGVEKESTLKAKLYNSLRWLLLEGSPEQRAGAVGITFAKIGSEYVLTLRRRGVAAFRAARTASHMATPQETERAKHGPSIVFREVRAEVIRYLCNTNWNGEGKRPCFQRVGVTLSDAQRDELCALVEAHGGFAADVLAGYNGTIMIMPLKEGEV